MFYLNQREYSHIPYMHDLDHGGAAEKLRNLGTSGCGLCCACMVVEHLTGKTLELIQCIRLSEESGANHCPGCDMSILGPAVAEQFGLTYRRCGDVDTLIAHLRSGGEAVALVCRQEDGSPGIFTGWAHYMLLTACNDNVVTILDPNYAKGKFQAQEEAGLIRVEEPFLYCDLATLVAEARYEQPYFLFGTI